MSEDATVAIGEVLRAYGDGIFEGDVIKLRAQFHPRAMLYGEVRGEPYCRTLDEYLGIVARRQSPQALGESHGMSVTSVSVAGEIAMARMRCVMLGYDYADFLSLVREKGRWLIVSKVFTDQGHV